MIPEKDSEYLHRMWFEFRKGNKEAFAVFYNLHIDRVYRYGMKICHDESLVKDTIQEIFLDLYLKRKSNKTTPENLRFYLFLAVKRSLIKKIKYNRRIDRCEISDKNTSVIDFGVECQLIKDEKDKERRERVVNALNKLPPKQKEVVYLRFNEGMNYNNIAKILEINIESVRKHIYRALKEMKEELDKQSFMFFLYSFRKNK